MVLDHNPIIPTCNMTGIVGETGHACPFGAPDDTSVFVGIHIGSALVFVCVCVTPCFPYLQFVCQKYCKTTLWHKNTHFL